MALIATGNQEASTHNAIGKIYITLNRDPVSFLTNDPYYEPKVLGKFCEKLDPSLAFAAYKRGAGECDDDLITVCQENGLFKDLARYLVEKQDLETWATVLALAEDGSEPPHRRSLLVDPHDEAATVPGEGLGAGRDPLGDQIRRFGAHESRSQARLAQGPVCVEGRGELPTPGEGA